MNVTDVTPHGSPVQFTPDQVMGALASAIAWATKQQRAQYPNASQRWDSAGKPVMPSRHALDAYVRHCDRLAIQRWREEHGELPGHVHAHYRQRIDSLRQRNDAADLAGGAPGHVFSDFEHIRTEVLEQIRKPLNGKRLFTADTAVPLGATTHSVRRRKGTGEAERYRGGTVTARANTTYLKEEFEVGIYVCAVETDYFEQLSTDFAGLQKYQHDAETAIRAIEERINYTIWFGEIDARIRGALTYPDMPTSPFPVVFNDAADGKLIVRALNNAQNLPYVVSGASGDLTPDTLVVSPRIRAFMSSTPFNPLATDTTIAKYYLDNQDPNTGVTRIEAAQELEKAGPNGEDGLFWYKSGDKRALAHVDIQSPTFLPVYQADPLKQHHLAIAVHGGVTQFNIAQIVQWATVQGLGGTA